MRGRGKLTVALLQPSGAQRRKGTGARVDETGLCSEKLSMVREKTWIIKWAK
jgi:hypothetical protein